MNLIKYNPQKLLNLYMFGTRVPLAEKLKTKEYEPNTLSMFYAAHIGIFKRLKLQKYIKS